MGRATSAKGVRGGRPRPSYALSVQYVMVVLLTTRADPPRRMDVSVVIATFRRAWSLPLALESLTAQTRMPDEVVVVLKPSGDGSEDVIKEYESKLPIKLLIQRRGNVTDAVEMGYRSASGDLVLFIDDDAIAHKELALFTN